MTYEVWQGFAVSDAGDVLDGATVTVTVAGTGDGVTLFADKDGAESLDNPFTTDETGLVRFYAAAQFVDIVATKGADTIEFMNVRLGLPDALQTVATLAELQGVVSPSSAGNRMFDGSEWEWLSGDYSTQAAADSYSAVYATSDTVANTVGIWHRKYEVLLPRFWGDATLVATVQKFVDYCSATGDPGYITESVVLDTGLQVDSNLNIFCTDNVIFDRQFAVTTPNQGKFTVGDPTIGTKNLAIGPDTVTEDAWAGSTSYVVDDLVYNSRGVYKCIAAGTSAATGGPSNRGRRILDNDVEWEYLYSTKTHRPQYTNINWHGGTCRSSDESYTGPHWVFQRCGDSVLDGVKTDGVFDDYNVMISGHRNRIINFDILGGFDGNEDGIHIWGGENNEVLSGRVRCGDDCIAIGNSHDIDTLNNIAADINAHSAVAYMVKIVNGDSALYPSADHLVQDNRAENINGSGNKGAIAVWDEKDGGYVNRNKVVGVEADLRVPVDGFQGYGAWVLDSPNTEIGLTCRGPYRSALKGEGSANLTARIDSNGTSVSGSKVIDIDGCSKLDLFVRVAGNNDHVIDVQDSQDINIRGHVTDIPDGKAAVFLGNVDGFTLALNCLQAGTTGKGVVIKGDCNNGDLNGSDFSSVATPVEYTSGRPTKLRLESGRGRPFKSYSYRDVNVGVGTTAGYARTNASLYCVAGESRIFKASTDDLWDLTGVTTGVADYKNVLLCIDSSGNAEIVEGAAGTSVIDAPTPTRDYNQAVIAVVEIPPSYSGGSLAGYTFHDIIGEWHG